MASLRKNVNRLVGQVMHRYDLLAEGDRIMVALSGGADSMLTLWLLEQWKHKAPISYRLMAVHLDMGFPGHNPGPMTRYLDARGISYHTEETDYGMMAHSSANTEKSPCFLCAMLRRKRLFELADRFGCRKIALGHNLDDIIETFFMNVCYGGEMSTMVPMQEMFDGALNLIRPLAFVEKSKVRRLVKQLGLPVVPNLCPSASTGTRTELRMFLDRLYMSNPNVRGNIRRALSRIRRQYLLG